MSAGDQEAPVARAAPRIVLDYAKLGRAPAVLREQVRTHMRTLDDPEASEIDRTHARSAIEAFREKIAEE
ncbi:hypothetical protein ABGN05_20025 [Aquibium sp. LZ166]|uniref:Uncharacterized protein n=1 Tax=Aquibium pacificus TaxID=3153579 RepID=A0ABV3SNR8_9HYPH